MATTFGLRACSQPRAPDAGLLGGRHRELLSREHVPRLIAHEVRRQPQILGLERRVRGRNPELLRCQYVGWLVATSIVAHRP